MTSTVVDKAGHRWRVRFACARCGERAEVRRRSDRLRYCRRCHLLMNLQATPLPPESQTPK